jgi:hypothetical protein
MRCGAATCLALLRATVMSRGGGGGGRGGESRSAAGGGEGGGSTHAVKECVLLIEAMRGAGARACREWYLEGAAAASTLAQVPRDVV